MHHTPLPRRHLDDAAHNKKQKQLILILYLDKRYIRYISAPTECIHTSTQKAHQHIIHTHTYVTYINATIPECIRVVIIAPNRAIYNYIIHTYIHIHTYTYIYIIYIYIYIYTCMYTYLSIHTLKHRDRPHSSQSDGI
jgi:hypothetical protein